MNESSRGSFLPAGNRRSEEFELNLAPVIDCLTVLIVYTMVSASFLSLGVFETTMPAESGASAAVAEVQLRLDLNGNRSINIYVSGKESIDKQIPAREGDWDLDALSAELKSIKAKWSSLTTATVAAQPAVEYREVVRLIERTKQSLPHVVLGD